MVLHLSGMRCTASSRRSSGGSRAAACASTSAWIAPSCSAGAGNPPIRLTPQHSPLQLWILPVLDCTYALSASPNTRVARESSCSNTRVRMQWCTPCEASPRVQHSTIPKHAHGAPANSGSLCCCAAWTKPSSAAMKNSSRPSSRFSTAALMAFCSDTSGTSPAHREICMYPIFVLADGQCFFALVALCARQSRCHP